MMYPYTIHGSKVASIFTRGTAVIELYGSLKILCVYQYNVVIFTLSGSLGL